ncbi:MAG: hypothetical protein IJC07_04115 [Clostridia bacterium]|nr:hypothetical protein [Clostridia bacterium]
MTVKEIIKTTAILLGREDVTDYLDNKVAECGEETSRTIGVLIELVNLVVGELASTYIPAVKTEEVKFVCNKAYYGDFTERVIKVLSVTDRQGKDVDVVQDVEFLSAPLSIAFIEYEYLPKNFGLDDEICYTEKDVAPHVLAHGVLAEYAITQGSFDEAVMWHKRYVDGVEAICLPKNVTAKRRRWA